MRGWLARIHREHTIDRQLPFYERLNRFFAFIREWSLLRFDEPAADEFKRLRAQGVRIGSMDLKIASIVLVHDALLLSANLKDFQRVPGLRVESWLEQ